MRGKVCRKCWKWCFFEELVKKRTCKNNRARMCKVCQNRASKQWNKDNLARKRKYNRQHYADNREHKKKGFKLYYINNKEQWVRKNGKYRALKLATEVESIDYNYIYERDEGICHICSEDVELEDCHMDHVIPLSKGGTHTYDNIKVSHSGCNLRKGASLDLDRVRERILQERVVSDTSSEE